MKPVIIFFGNTKYSTIGLQIVQSVYPITLIVTKSNQNPVKLVASELNIPVLGADHLTPEIIDQIRSKQPDFLLVEDYGLIMPKNLLDVPKLAPINVHHSLLPKYRGASPAPAAILNGEVESGVTVMKMAEAVDSGDILAQEGYQLKPDETTDSLLTILNQIGGRLAIEVIKRYLEDTANPVPQNSSKATFTKRFTKENGYFDISSPPAPEILDRMIRAYYPWPGVWTKWNNKIVKFYPTSSHPELSAQREALFISGSTKKDSGLRQNDNTFLIQMEGKNIQTLKDFHNGYPNFPLDL